MDRFGKMYGAHKKLGQDFVTSVVDVHFGDLEPCVFLRVASILANLASDKQSDGVAKLLVSSDVERLKGKSVKDKAIALDRDLSKSYRLAGSLRASGHIDLEQHDMLVGQFFTRSVLLLVGKDKQGSEGVVFESQAPIISDFVSEAASMSGCGVVIDPDGEWKPHAPLEASEPHSTDDRAVVMTEGGLRKPERI